MKRTSVEEAVTESKRKRFSVVFDLTESILQDAEITQDFIDEWSQTLMGAFIIHPPVTFMNGGLNFQQINKIVFLLWTDLEVKIDTIKTAIKTCVWF